MLATFLGFYGLFGWVHLGVVHRCLTGNRCPGAHAVRARCTNTLGGRAASAAAAGARWRGGCAAAAALRPTAPSPARRLDMLERMAAQFVLRSTETRHVPTAGTPRVLRVSCSAVAYRRIPLPPGCVRAAVHRRRRGGTPPLDPAPPPPLLPFQCLRLTARILLRRLRCQED